MLSIYPSMEMDESSKYSAAALKYDLNESSVPKVIASGTEVTAEEIIQIAKEHGIPIREDPALMEMLMKVEILDDIPEEAFALVAEIFAFIYEMNLKAQKKDNHDYDVEDR